jgi:hypothetical protein
MRVYGQAIRILALYKARLAILRCEQRGPRPTRFIQRRDGKVCEVGRVEEAVLRRQAVDDRRGRNVRSEPEASLHGALARMPVRPGRGGRSLRVAHDGARGAT